MGTEDNAISINLTSERLSITQVIFLSQIIEGYWLKRSFWNQTCWGLEKTNTVVHTEIQAEKQGCTLKAAGDTIIFNDILLLVVS